MTATETKAEKPLFEEHEVDMQGSKKKGLPVKSVVMNASDATLNALVDAEGTILSGITVDGLGSLLAQARSNYGVKKGRYYYEVTVMEAQHCVFRIGFSTLNAKFVGAENSVCFTNLYRFRSNGEVGNPSKGIPAFNKNDTIGVLLNMDPKANDKTKNTISLFVNGKRASEPQPIPAPMLKQALYAHVAFRGCSLGVHFDVQQKPLPFTVCMMGQAQPSDMEKSPIVCVENPKAVFPVGLEVDEYINDFLQKKIGYMELSHSYFTQWCKESSFNKKADNFYGLTCLDNANLLSLWLRLRPRNVIIALGCGLFPKEREKKLQLCPSYDKECVVLPIKTAGSAGKVYSNYADVTLPTEEEGFVAVTYVSSKAEEEKNLESWLKDQKLRSKVNDLQVGSWFTERLADWNKFVSEKKATDEGLQFSEEDWMLANIRAELVNIVHAFKNDVNDEERPSFPPALTDSYYKTYVQKSFHPMNFACESVEGLISEHLSDTVSVDEKGLLSAKLEKDIPLEKIWELVDTARIRRETRVGSGDELYDLKFSASRPHKTQYKSKGGFKRPIPFAAQQEKRQRV